MDKKAFSMQEKIIQSLGELREKQPLVHNITNDVVTNTTANALLAIGASPIMAQAIEEVADMVGITNSLVINSGTLTRSSLESMILATETAHNLDKRWILDPVGVGATPFRLTSNKQLLEYKPSVVRGNASEIKALFTGANEGKGVDSSSSSESTLHFIQEKAREHQLVIAVTGATDYVTDGYEVYQINNGHPMMARVTGTGCTATAIIGAFLAICDTPLMAAVSGLTCLGIAGELASMDCPGPGSLQLRMLDELYRLDQSTIQKFEKVSNLRRSCH
ncbi:hydroxyethylthiazole kinase [Endozoicomonas elysicola]|uniref:Hydroxyethylthiazole kinase n=2 Tax=Endozoicomonas elysicola TaxID=305900 RepID=A0A081KAH6_9GAMM|nr:hydroxyethylthiazole kinase [Endozoicomonas elysicola]